MTDAHDYKDAPVVAIDGPAGAGKSTVARAVAKRLGLIYADTGKLYRALALKAADVGISVDDKTGIEALCGETDIGYRYIDGESRVFLDGADVTDKLAASEKVGELASALSALAEVRTALLEVQRSLARPPGLVMEGRDIGTVVFPDATVKFYLDASVEERAGRRLKDLLAKGENVTFEEVAEQLRARDERDRNRKVAPLRRADDAVYVDTTDMSFDEVVNCLVGHVKRGLGNAEDDETGH
ncbi:MAG: (d)CMP kinase [Candidatus Coatesbacteria bacterium]|nr:MAG: (d)CMP kinase [Candidatus Coatesbacteria bacterium]